MTARIVYLSWPANEISGGIKMAYRHVEVLRAAGWEAVIATPDGQAPRWFQSSAPTLDLTAVTPSTDILVFPENFHQLLHTFGSWPNRKVVFCQNQFLAHRGLAGAGCYSSFGVTDILAEGRHVVDFCERRFPRLRIHSVPVYVDTDVFRCSERKRLQIAYAPRKRPLEAEVIRDLFRADQLEHRDIPWVPIADCTEGEVASILANSTHYLALCRFEAFPLSILEAFASGCIVAGFTGFGARNYTTSDNGFWAEEDNCLDCATQLGKAVSTVIRGANAYHEMVNASISVTRRFSRSWFSDRVLQFWNQFLPNPKNSTGGSEKF